MTELRRWPVARKRHLCDICRDPIAPGARYMQIDVPPGRGEFHSDHWLRYRVHGYSGSCPTDGVPVAAPATP